MLRLHPTTITLTGNDIALAMDHMQSSKANASETSTSVTSPHPEQKQQKSPGKHYSSVHRQLQTLLANNEDYAGFQRHSEDASYDDLDGSFEELNIHSDDAEQALSSPPRSIGGSLDFLPALSLPVGSSTGYMAERAAWGSTNLQETQPYNFPHLDGVSMSISADDWYRSRSNSPRITDEMEYSSEGVTDASTPILSPASSTLSAPSSRGPRTPSPRATGMTLGEGTASADASSEYYVTSTCPEFVGPSEAFSLMAIFSDPSHLSTTAHSPTIATDFISPNNNSRSETRTSLTPPPPPQDAMFNFHRRTMGTYNNPGNVEHTESVFSPFTYSPEEPMLDDVDQENLVPSPPSTEWDDASRGQEGGATWDLRGRRM